MILHCVYCDFRASVKEVEKRNILVRLAQFSETLDGVVSFEFGPNKDFEQKSANYDWGFVIKFTDDKALENYAEHPEHKALGGELVALCEGGADGIVVFDLDV